MQKITTFLTFNGRAGEALDFYASVLKNSRITFRRKYGENGNSKFLIGGLEFDGQEFLLLEGGPDFSFSMGISLMIHCNDQAEIDYYWQKLSEGGSTIQCGWLQDKFGVSWQVVPRNINELMSSDAALQAIWGMEKIIIADLEKAIEGKEIAS